MALLYSDEVPQDAECNTGFLFQNCDGERIDVHDSDTHQLDTDSDAPFGLESDSAIINFQVQSGTYTLSPTQIVDASISFDIHIVALAKNGAARQDILDTIQERILYRIFSYQEFTDAQTGETLKSFMRDIKSNTVSISVSDETGYDGSTTIRTLSFSYQHNECPKKLGCKDAPICFDFSEIGVDC